MADGRAMHKHITITPARRIAAAAAAVVVALPIGLVTSAHLAVMGGIWYR